MRHALPLLLLLPACSDYDLKGTDEDPDAVTDSEDTETPETGGEDACAPLTAAPEAVPLDDSCDYAIGGFEPVISWEVDGKWSDALPAVGDLDGDGLPEIVATWTTNVLNTEGRIVALHGDGSGTLWQDTSTKIGFGTAPAIADIDDDGQPEVLTVRQYGSSLLLNGQYAVVAYSWDGRIEWESETFVDEQLDYATGLIVSDMDHDGSPEIVAGAVVLNADGTTRGQNEALSRGCPTDMSFIPIVEGTFPAVADLDLDGVEEVVTGNSIFTADGDALWYEPAFNDGSVAIANLDDDPEGEFVVSNWNTIRAHDTDGDLLWGPVSMPNANILPIPAVADIDADGEVELLVAGGNSFWALRRDGSLFWDYPVTDMSGATGASVFDFDADGIPEVVYMDEVELLAFNGADGTVKFHSTDHSSDTMYDYPVIADVDVDGHADIVMTHNGAYHAGLSVYRDATNSWAPVRSLWNQHAYSITNINDDLSVPATATPNFTVYNSWHSALPLPPGAALDAELEAEILDICELDCERGTLRVLVRAENTGNTDVDAGVPLALYGITGGGDVLLGTALTAEGMASGMSSSGVELEVDATTLAEVSALYLVVDDDGTGTGHVAECLETNNGATLDGPFCR